MMDSLPTRENEHYWADRFMEEGKAAVSYDRELWFLLAQLSLACELKAVTIERLDKEMRKLGVPPESLAPMPASDSALQPLPNAVAEQWQKGYFHERALAAKDVNPELFEILDDIETWCGLKARLLGNLRKLREDRGLIAKACVQ